MSIKHGLTTWIVSLGRVAVMWRWNMRFAEALRTAAVCRHPAYCFVTAGPLIVEWQLQPAGAHHGR